MHRPYLLLTLAWLCCYGSLLAQGYAFGIKGGPSLGLQRWDNSFQRDPLLAYHGALFIESLATDARFALFAQGGLHLKGSSIRIPRTTAITTDNRTVEIPGQSTNFIFRNLAVSVGAKQKLDLGLGNNKFYYLFGIRGDYTLSTDLGPAATGPFDWFAIYYPQPEFVRKINYGAIFGGGLELQLSELVGAFVEISVNPDFSAQYYQPEIRNIINPNPFGGGSLINIPERRINNTTVELSLGLRFLHKIIYVD